MAIQSRKRPADAAPGARVPDVSEPTESATYQSLLDEALCMTFPASDPIAVGAAMQVMPERPTGKDDHDWPLVPGGSPPVRLPPR
jgi:hypothetical protein